LLDRGIYYKGNSWKNKTCILSGGYY
jgi:hypothetical protein